MQSGITRFSKAQTPAEKANAKAKADTDREMGTVHNDVPQFGMFRNDDAVRRCSTAMTSTSWDQNLHWKRPPSFLAFWNCHDETDKIY